MPFPLTINEMVALTGVFDTEHKSCPKTWSPPVNDDAASKTEEENLTWWLQHGEHGTSSLTIVRFLTPAPMRHLVDLSKPLGTPVDPDDFKRCEFLLRDVPQFREKMAKMKDQGPVWANLVNNWDALVVLLNQQLAGKKNSMYEFMKTLGC